MKTLGDAARISGDDLIITVRVTPRASRNEVRGIANGMLQVRVTAPPADGKANASVVKLLASFLRVPPSRIRLLRGSASRNKRFVVAEAANGL